MLLVGPPIIVLSLLGTEGLRHVVLWLELPLSSWAFEFGAMAAASAVFSLCTSYAPHAPVPWRSAVIGGRGCRACLGAGSTRVRRHRQPLLQRQHAVRLARRGAALPHWVYVAWYIVLSGARLAYAVEHADFHDEFRDLLEHPRSQELIASRIAELVTRAVQQGLAGLSTRALAAELKMPEQRVAEVCARLSEAGLLTSSPQRLLAPARSPDTLTVADISAAVGGIAQLANQERTSDTDQFVAVAAYFGAADQATVEMLKGITWAQLAET